jgi:hypothetical protein
MAVLRLLSVPLLPLVAALGLCLGGVLIINASLGRMSTLFKGMQAREALRVKARLRLRVKARLRQALYVARSAARNLPHVGDLWLQNQTSW